MCEIVCGNPKQRKRNLEEVFKHSENHLKNNIQNLYKEGHKTIKKTVLYDRMKM